LSKDNIHENILKSSFCCFSDVQKYTEFRIHKTPEGILDISPCELSCDIPDDWLQVCNFLHFVRFYYVCIFH